MDPVSTVVEDQDTSFALMLAAKRAGHSVEHALVQGVSWSAGELTVQAHDVDIALGSTPPVRLGSGTQRAVATYDVVWIRKDPPFDDSYLWLTLLLEHVRGQVEVLNDPRGLREANEKLYTLHFREFMPQSLVTADLSLIGDFVADRGGKAVLKPVDGHGGEGVFVLQSADPNFTPLVESATRLGSRVVMVQEFLPNVRLGDKRILLMDGEILGGLVRVPPNGEIRSNIHVGGSVHRAEITLREREIVETMAPRLAEDGLRFVGLDVIDGMLSEVNVTSPTGIQQMSKLDGRDYAADVIRMLSAQA